MQAPVEIGRVVKSKSGRDKDRFLVVYSYDGGNYVYLVDGALRKVASPKKKKLMHIEPTVAGLIDWSKSSGSMRRSWMPRCGSSLRRRALAKTPNPANKEG